MHSGKSCHSALDRLHIHWNSYTNFGCHRARPLNRLWRKREKKRKKKKGREKAPRPLQAWKNAHSGWKQVRDCILGKQ